MRSFRRIAGVAGFIALCLLINIAMNFMLIPYGYARVTFHNVHADEYEDIVVGTSHGLSAINPSDLGEETGRKTMNLCLGGEYIKDSYYIIKDVCRDYTPKRIIYELDPGYWVTKQVQDFEYGRIFGEMPFSFVKIEYFFAKIASADFRTTLFPWFNYRSQISNIDNNVKTKLGEDYKNYGVENFDGEGQSFFGDGFVYRKDVEGNQRPGYVQTDFTADKVLDESIKFFEKLRALCDKKGIELVVVTTPIPDATQESYSEEFNNSYEYFTKFMGERGVTYWNFNYMDVDFNRGLECYGDFEGHLFGKYATEFSRILGGYLNKLSS